MSVPRVTLVMRSELRDSWLPSDYMDGPLSCSECGFAPKKTGLLLLAQPGGPESLHPLIRQRPRFVCAHEAACKRRRA